MFEINRAQPVFTGHVVNRGFESQSSMSYFQFEYNLNLFQRIILMTPRLKLPNLSFSKLNSTESTKSVELLEQYNLCFK